MTAIRWRILIGVMLLGLACNFLLGPLSSNTATPPAPTAGGPRTAQLSELKNDVQAHGADADQWQAAAEREQLPVGGGAKTGADSRVRIDITDGTLIRLAGNTEFQLVEFSESNIDPVTQMTLAAGKLWTAFTAALGVGTFKVETPVGSATVRGTYMSVEYFPLDGHMIVSCLEGQCRLTGASGTFVDLLTGQQSEIPGFGQDPTPPQPIDAAQIADWAAEFPEAAPFVATITPGPQPTSTSIGTPPAPGGSPIAVTDLQIADTRVVPVSPELWLLVGEVTNTHPSAIAYSVDVGVEAFDAAGNSLDAYKTPLVIENLGPGGSAPFSFELRSETPVASFNASILTVSATSAAFAPLGMTEPRLVLDDDGGWHCLGELLNNGPLPIQIDRVGAAFLDDQNQIIAVSRQSQQLSYVEPGGRTPYRVSATTDERPASTPARCAAYPDAAASAPLAAPAAVTLADADGSGSSADDVLFILDEANASARANILMPVTNTGAEPMDVSVIAALYDAQGNVVDVSSGSSAFAEFAGPLPFALEAGQTLPLLINQFDAFLHTQTLHDQVADYKVYIDPLKTKPSEFQFVALEAESGSVNIVGSSYLASVTVTNTQTFFPKLVYVVHFATEPTGRIVGYGGSVLLDVQPEAASISSIDGVIDPTADPARLTYIVIAQTYSQ